MSADDAGRVKSEIALSKHANGPGSRPITPQDCVSENDSWGRIQRAVTLEPQSNPFDWAGWNFAPAADGGIHVKSSSAASGPAALAHVRALESNGAPCVWLGAVEPLLGRETVKRVPGRQVSKANICYCPGAVSLAPAGTTWTIGPYGIWQLPECSPQATD